MFSTALSRLFGAVPGAALPVQVGAHGQLAPGARQPPRGGQLGAALGARGRRQHSGIRVADRLRVENAGVAEVGGVRGVQVIHGARIRHQLAFFLCIIAPGAAPAIDRVARAFVQVQAAADDQRQAVGRPEARRATGGIFAERVLLRQADLHRRRPRHAVVPVAILGGQWWWAPYRADRSGGAAGFIGVLAVI